MELDTTGRTKILFIDMQEITDLKGLKLQVVQARKHPLNPVLPLGDVDEWDNARASPWESRTVIYDADDQCFKAWYAGGDLEHKGEWITGYAISPDGVRWTKPKLGLFEHRGSKQNNICSQLWGCVVKDKAETDPDKKYKMVAKGPPRQLGQRLNYSPDGIHWTEGPRINLPQWEGRAPDTVVFLCDDLEPEPSRRFKLVWQSLEPSNKPGPVEVRVKHLAWSPDALTWTTNPDNPILHPNDSTEQEDHFLMIIPLQDRGWSIMLYEYGWYLPNGTGLFGNYCADIRLAASRDGVHYTRIEPYQITIPRGERGHWDSGLLVVSDKAVIKDGTIYLYYAGCGEQWTSWPKQNRSSTPGLKQMTHRGPARWAWPRLISIDLPV